LKKESEENTITKRKEKEEYIGILEWL